MNSKTTSMKSLWIAVCFTALIVLSQFGGADCRALRVQEAPEKGAAAVSGGAEGGQELVGMTPFAVSSSNKSSKSGNTSNNNTRPLARSLAFRLASGPSKKGPGH